MDVLAAELQLAVPQHRTRQQAGLEKNLKTVADPQDRTARGGEPPDSVHDRGKAGDGAGPQVITVREAAGENHRIGAAKIGFLVPDELGLLAKHVFCGVIRVVVAVGSGKDNDGEFGFHGFSQFQSDSFR